MKVKKILAPYDFSETSRRALDYALDLGPTVGCEELTVLHVAIRPTEYLPLDDWIFGEHRPPKDVEAQVREATKKSLDKALTRRSPSSFSLRSRVEFGAASSTILEVAKELGTELIVIGTRGRNAKMLQRTAGSTAVRVIRGAACPVLSIG